MSTPELTTVLEECLRLAGTVPTLDKETFKSTRGLLSAELNSLLQEAMDMKWPFVEEKWQYKRSVESEDKVNTIDLIKQHLPQLIAFLKACISAAEPLWAMSVVFLMDRFLYLIDSSHTLLKIAKALHRRYPETPVAPQIVIRQARIYLNTGKLQKAEYILSSLISNCGATGCWKYHRDSDRILVQAVSVQVRGQVLQKLGLWLEAAELIWASLIGFYILPLPDKKGIGTSLGLLASVLISMNDEDFATFQTRPHINLYCYFVTQGTCLLSYSFSKNCPAAEKPHYLTLAKEAFENGLLTKAETDAVTSQQELHTLIKAAYCLAITNKWMFGLAKEVTMAIQSCQEANALLYFYCFKDDSNKGAVSSEVMAKVQRIKSLLKVKAFVSSDPCSFIPDSYRAMKDKPVAFTLGDFTKMMEGFQKHHKSVCEAFKASEQKGRRSGQGAAHANCITAFQTTLTESFTTECTSTSLQADANKDIMDSNKPRGPSVEVFQKEILDATLDFDEYHPDHCSSRGSKLGENSKEGVKSEAQGARTSQGSSSLGSSWINMPDSEASSVLVDPFCCTEAEDDVYDEKIGHGASAEAVRNNVTGCSGANAADASDRIGDNHQTGMLALLQSAGVLDKGGNTQQQSKQDLSTTLESEDGDQILSKIDVNGTGKGKERRMTSGSLNSSLGSSWQSISFSKSLPTGEFAEILKDKSIIDQKCETVTSEDSPDSPFELINLNSALVLKYSKATDRWTGCETSVYVGELLEVAVKGGQRQAFRIQYLHQEQMLGSYVGKEYLRERKAHAHLADVERQMTAQYYVMEFNKCLYESNITTQIFYIPSELLLILEDDCIVACISVEPYMLGEFVKLTNNRTKRNERYSTTKYGIAFGHFTFEFSKRKEVVVDLQGWVTANGKGLVYLTDPQIHSIIKPKSPSNFHKIGIMEFLQEQHGEDCSPICRTALNNLKQRSTLKQ
uniref:Alpha-type protein kinase domain-containing protein n=1 Tax=Pygocentrus nattereri TaxID=42514 RepID=A0A3B4BS97_PYGNA